MTVSVQSVGDAVAIQVPISDYRANLKAWHERVLAGEDILITEHGKPVVLVTLPSEEAFFQELERRGVLTRPTRKPSLDELPRFTLTRRSEDIIDEMRGE